MANDAVPGEAIRKQMLVLIPVKRGGGYSPFVFSNIFLLGCVNGWISNAIYFFTIGNEVSATLAECSWIASLGEIGRMLFAIPAGILFDKCSRKSLVVANGAIYLFSWLLLSLSINIYAIYLSRFFTGVALALNSASSSAIMGEIASAEIRGSVVSSAHILYVLGSLFESVITSIFSSYRILSYSTTALSFIFLLNSFWFKETPNYLITISKYDRAKRHLQYIRSGYDQEKIDLEFETLKNYIEDEQMRKKQVSWLKFISSKPIRKPIITVMLIYGFASLTGNAVIGSYITIIVPEIESIPKKYYPLIIQVISIIASFLTPFYIEKFPRKFIYQLGTIVGCFTAIFTAIAYYWYELHVQENYIWWLLMAGNLVIVAIYQSALKPVQVTWKSELFPQAVKGFGTSLNSVVQSFCVVIAYESFIIITHNIGRYFNYLFYALNLLISFVIVFYLVPESRGKSLSDLQTESKL